MGDGKYKYMKNIILIKNKIRIKDIFFQVLDHYTFKNLDRHAKNHLKMGMPQLNIKAFDFVSNCVNFQGIYEKNILDLMFLYLKNKIEKIDEKVAIDVGANIGNHTLYFANYFNKVIAIEPQANNFELLKINKLLSLNKNIELLNIGISDIKDTMQIIMPDISNSGSTKLIEKNIKSKISELVKVDTLDNIIKENNIALIKIDVEGMELKVLNGAKEVIEKNQPFILFEHEKSNFINEQSDLLVILKKLKYNNFIIYKKFPSFPRFGTKLTKNIYHMISQLFTIQEENLFLIKADEIEKIDYK
jgi:FkbM family methyltransferase